MAFTLTTATRNAAVNAVVDLLDGGTGAGNVVFMTASGGSTLATCALSATAFGAASDGSAAIDTVTDDTNASAGTCTYASFQDGDGTEHFSCSVTASGGGGDIEFSTNVWSAGDTIGLSSFTVTCPAS